MPILCYTITNLVLEKKTIPILALIDVVDDICSHLEN